MKKNQIVKLEKKLVKVEKQLIGELFLANNVNNIIAFTQTYVSNYMPVLFFAIKHFDTNQIAGVMNSSILIDRLLSGRINDIIRSQVHSDVREFIHNHKIEKESTIVKLLNRQTVLNKANLSSTLLFMFSFIRSAMFSFYCDKKLYTNYGIGWNNMLIHFVRNPHLAFMLEKKGIEKAESELEFLKNDIAKRNGELAKEIKKELLKRDLIQKKDFPKVEIHFVRLKLDWLKAKALVEYCKFLKSSNKKNLSEAIEYSNRVLTFLESEEFEYHEFSFRKKLTYPTPSPNLKKIIGDLNDYEQIAKVFEYTCYFESDNKKMVIVFPTGLEYYFNYNQVFERKNGVSPILEDEEFLLEVHERGCFSFLDKLDNITVPNESEAYNSWKEIHELFISLEKDGLSNKFIYEQLKKTEASEVIVKKFEKTINSSRLIANALGLSVISGINFYAEANGLSKIPAYTNTTVPLMTEVIINTIYKSKYDKLLLETFQDDENENGILGFDENDEYSSLKDLENRIENLEDTSESLAELMNMDGLKEIITTNQQIRDLLMSTKPIEEINKELQGMYDSLK